MTIKNKYVSVATFLLAPAVAVVAAATVFVGGTAKAVQIQQQGFTGYYDPANWTLIQNGGNGKVNSTGAQGSITLTGSDRNDGSELPVDTSYTIAASSLGTVGFSWDFETLDSEGGGYDGFGFAINGVFTELATFKSSGITTFNVSEGDIFGFLMTTADDRNGPGIATISNFVFTPASSANVPGPLPVLGLSAAFYWTRRLRLRLAKKSSTPPYRMG